MRRISIGAFIVALALIVVGAGIAGLVVWPNVSGLPNQLAAESLVVAIASLLIALLAGIIATIAFVQSTRQPLLQLRTRITSDYLEPPDHLVPDEEQLSVGQSPQFRLDRFKWTESPGTALWIEIHNARNVAATHPAVRVELLEFEIEAGLQANQTGWRSVPPQEGGVFAWLWSGDERTVHGPGWSEALPALSLFGSSPRYWSTNSRSIKISTIADDADGAEQRITFF